MCNFALISQWFLSFTVATSMELNDTNLQTLTEFLRKTLDPDPSVRRPGEGIWWNEITLPSSDCSWRMYAGLVNNQGDCFICIYVLKHLSSFYSSSWKVSWVCWRKPELPYITSHFAGEIPGQCNPGLCCSHIQELHQEELAHSTWKWRDIWVRCHCCVSPVDLYIDEEGCVLSLSSFFSKVEDEPNKISDPDRTTIKANIVNLMLSSPEQIQKQVRLLM